MPTLATAVRERPCRAGVLPRPAHRRTQRHHPSRPPRPGLRSGRGRRRGRGPAQPPPAPHRERLSRRREHRRAHPRLVHRRRGGALGRADARRAGRARAAPRPRRRGPGRPRCPALDAIPRRARAPGQCPLGVDDGSALGLVHARGPDDPGVGPPARRARRRARLRAAPRAGAPPGHRPRAVLLGGCSRRTRGSSGRAASSRGSTTPRAVAAQQRPTAARASETSGVSSPRVPGGRASTGHHRTSSDSALTRGLAPAGATAA